MIDILASHPDAQRPAEVPTDVWRAFLDDALRRSGLLTVRSGEFVFLHQTLLEYLAARHVIPDEQDGARLLRRLFGRWTRYGPSTNDPGIKCRLWFRKIWRAPLNVEASYLGFLLDVAQEKDPAATDVLLQRLVRRGGFEACRFVAEQARLGTLVPAEIIDATADRCAALAQNTTLNSALRVKATESLGALDDPRGRDLYAVLAADTTLDDHWQMRAAAMMVKPNSPDAPLRF
ncbi:hypothetical protein [Kitasatospora sp. NPDC092286]|uniref:hypothetical protein n=1 Tax=Kitasatospora sp. NPDC092286 TaxID=3364087 RepID=UPI0038205837